MLRSGTKPPTRSELTTQGKRWTDVRNIKWNKDTHGHSCNKGTNILFSGGLFLHWIWQDPTIFLSAKTWSKHFLSWTLAFISSKKLQAKWKKKKQTAFWKFLLNYSLSGIPSFINYLFSIFWQWINLFSLWWRANYSFSQQQQMRIKICI